MNRIRLAGLIPPLVVLVVAILLIPTDFYSVGALIALLFLAGLYFLQITLPTMAPKSDSSLIHSSTYAVLVWPAVIAAAIVALLALFISGFSWRWVLAIDIAILGAVLAAAFLTTFVSERDAKLDADTRRSVTDLRRLALTVESVAASSEEPVTQKQARQVAEQIRLSPFLGVPASAPIEEEISTAVAGLVVVSDADGLSKALSRISRLVEQRNQIVKVER